MTCEKPLHCEDGACVKNGQAQATITGHTYEKKIESQRFSCAFAFVIQKRENPKSWDFFFFFFFVFSLVIVSVRMVLLRGAEWQWILNGGVSQFVPTCPVLSPFVLFCPDLSPLGAPRRTKEDKWGKTGHFGTNWEKPPFSIHPRTSSRSSSS